MIPSTFFRFSPESILSKLVLNSKNELELHKPVIFAVSILTVIWYTWLILKLLRKNRYPMPPGPRGLPILGRLPFLEPELHSHFAHLARIYGPILSLRLGAKKAVVISSPEMAREVLKENDVTFANRDVPCATKAFEYSGHDVVFTPYGSEWRMLRKVCVRDMLGHTVLDSFYVHRKQEVRNTVKYFYSLRGTHVNVGEQLFLNMLNVVTNMLWGGTIKGDERSIIGAEFRQVVSEITELLGKPNVSDFFPSLAWLDLQGMEKKMKEVVLKLERIFDQVIGQREKMGGFGEGTGKDFLQVLLKLKDEGRDAKSSTTPLTTNHVKALLLDMVVGGTDTTSSTVEFALAEMMNKQQVMIRAQQELDSVVGKNNMVEESHLSKLPYLQAIMKEILRLHPVLPLMVPHCPSKSCIVGGYTVPKGARVFINVWAIHRDGSIWEKPTEFIPERFLDGRGDYSGNDFNYIPFGSGRRICAGIAMAERVVMFTLASLVHSFDWKPAKLDSLDLSEKFGIVLKKRIPLIAIPMPRLLDATVYE